MSGLEGQASAAAALVDNLIGGRYLVKHPIGRGSFGEIFLGTDIGSPSREDVAIKVEAMSTKYPQLLYEYRVYIAMKGAPGLPNVRWCGSAGKYNVMVMDLLGDSLETLYNKCKRKFSLKTVLMLAVQLIDRVQHQHENHYLHRDIKPDNFLMGLPPNPHILFLIDMGLSKRYRDPVTFEHIPFRDKKKLTGTPRYASINTHKGAEQCRRDDLESMGYMLLYFLCGRLPWQGLKARTKQEKYDKIGQKKMSTPIEELCRGQPREFYEYLRYTRQLKFTEEPNYKYLRGLFSGLFKKNGYTEDWVFDWMLLTEYKHALPPAEVIHAAKNAPIPRAPSVAPLTYYQVQAAPAGLARRRDPAQPATPSNAIINAPTTSSPNLLQRSTSNLQQLSTMPITAPALVSDGQNSVRLTQQRLDEKAAQILTAYERMEAERDHWKRKAEDAERQNSQWNALFNQVRRHLALYCSVPFAPMVTGGDGGASPSQAMLTPEVSQTNVVKVQIITPRLPTVSLNPVVEYPMGLKASPPVVKTPVSQNATPVSMPPISPPSPLEPQPLPNQEPFIAQEDDMDDDAEARSDTSQSDVQQNGSQEVAPVRRSKRKVAAKAVFTANGFPVTRSRKSADPGGSQDVEEEENPAPKRRLTRRTSQLNSELVVHPQPTNV